MHRLIGPVCWLAVSLLLIVPMGGWRLLHGGGAVPDPSARTYGASYPVPDFEWVVLLNSGGLPTEDGRLAFFDTCLIRYRGSVREVTSHHSWFATLSSDVLVEYAPPTRQATRGVLCPQGAVFLLPESDLADYPHRSARRGHFESQLAEEVTRAAALGTEGDVRWVREELRWVEAVNPEGLESHGYRIGFLDVCGIERGGTVRPLAPTSAGPLYAYDPDPGLGFRGIGIPCPPGTFFLEAGTARPRG